MRCFRSLSLQREHFHQIQRNIIRIQSKRKQDYRGSDAHDRTTSAAQSSNTYIATTRLVAAPSRLQPYVFHVHTHSSMPASSAQTSARLLLCTSARRIPPVLQGGGGSFARRSRARWHAIVCARGVHAHSQLAAVLCIMEVRQRRGCSRAPGCSRRKRRCRCPECCGCGSPHRCRHPTR